MKKQFGFMFSGQGSQYHHMGKELYEFHPRFRYWMDRCDEIARPLIGDSLIEILYRKRGKHEPFDYLLHSNPALLSIEYSLARVLAEMGIRPDFVMGYSLGEIVASAVADVLSLEDALEMVAGMARILEEKTPLAEMLAILESPEIFSAFPELFHGCWMTGRNFGKSFVVTGLPGDIQALQEGLAERRCAFQKLPVKYGFHTPLIDPAEAGFKRSLAKLSLSRMSIPIISTLLCGPLRQAGADYYWDIIRTPVDFEAAILGIVGRQDCLLIDVGPSGTLATFVKYLLPPGSGSKPLQTLNPFGKNLISIGKLMESAQDRVLA